MKVVCPKCGKEPHVEQTVTVQGHTINITHCDKFITMSEHYAGRTMFDQFIQELFEKVVEAWRKV
jgi:hypothetical protein